MVTPVTLTKQDITNMAEMIHLSIPEERLAEVTQNTEAWFNNANKLAEKMMAEDYLELIPLSVVRFPD